MEQQNDKRSDPSVPTDRFAIEDRLDRLWAEESPGTANVAHASIVGKMVGNYRIRTSVGAGAFGVVYVADDTVNERPVAVKLPRPEVLIDPEMRERFLNESKLISQLDHPGIIKIFEAGTDGPVPFLVTEWCHGPDLSQWLALAISNRALPTWQDSTQFVAKIADAMHHAHQRGVSHRDLKPANILLVPRPGHEYNAPQLRNYLPKVADFGLAKLVDPIATSGGSSLLVGTPIYMAPELVEGNAAMHCNTKCSADIYSLGVILFELLTGELPVGGVGYFEVLKNIRSARRNRLSAFRKDLPRQLETVCATCLSRNLGARYESPAALADDLRRVVNEQAVRGQKTSLWQRYRFWHVNQNWLQTSGWFSLSYCVLLMAWFGPTAIAFAFFSVVPTEAYIKMVPMAFGVFVFSLLLPAVFAVMCLQGKRWAAWGTALINVPKVVSSIPGMFGAPLSFRAYYENYSPYLCFTVHLFIFICAFSQLLLSLLAIHSFSGKANSRG